MKNLVPWGLLAVFAVALWHYTEWDELRNFLVDWKDAAPAAGAITAMLSATVALLVFNYTRAVNRRRATLDMVMKTLMDDSVQKIYGEFKSLIRRDQDPNDCFKMHSLAEESAIGSSERKALLRQLNVYELMALGINRGLFDESFYKRWYHNQFMMDFEGTREFIEILQTKKVSIYCEASTLYRRWSRNGHPDATPNRLKMAYWGLTQQGDKIDAARAAAKVR